MNEPGWIDTFNLKVDEDIDLRLLEEKHARDLFALVDRNRDYLRPWMVWVDDTRSVEDTRKFRRAALCRFQEKKGLQAGIFFEGRLVGVIGYNKIDWPGKSATLGYWLGASFQGRGIMTRACHAMLRYAFDELRLHRVEIQAAVENTKSRAIPERLGFKHERTVEQAQWLNDHFADYAVYGISAEEWRRRVGE